MKKMITLIAILVTKSALADVYVQGYVRQDGTYVQGYNRTSPDNNQYNNYSTKGNTNPYTDQPGTRNPTQPGYGNNYPDPNFGTNNFSQYPNR